MGLKEKLDCGGKFKSEIVEAIKLDPADGVSHHLYGRWCLEVAGLNYFTKIACAKLIGAPPESTYDEALACFLKAESVHELFPSHLVALYTARWYSDPVAPSQLSPGTWKSNQLCVAKAYMKLGNKTEAKTWLTKVL